MKFCDYGCGNEARFTFKNGKICCSKNHKQCITKRKTNRKYKEGKPHKIVKCKFCNKELFFANLRVHEDACILNQKNIKKCLNCNKIIKNKFCSKSCSNSYNNKNRKHSEETKRKIGKSIKDKSLTKMIILYLLKIKCPICEKTQEIKTKSSNIG